MEYLRWILLLAGVLFVLVVYFVSRKSRSDTAYADNPELDSDLPEISTHDDWDQLDEGVGDVRVVARFDDADDVDVEIDLDTIKHDKPSIITSAFSAESVTEPAAKAGARAEDLVTLYLLAKDEPLSGDMINSAAYANGLVFGAMNIFHRLDDNNEPIYSMANMMEPGHFDPKNIHSLKTRGLVLFIQLGQLKHSSEALHDLLRCAYRMAEMIGARLCNHKRQPLTEKDTIAYRELAARFDDES